MGFAAKGNLYGIDGNGILYRIDPATANLTEIGSTGLSLFAYGMGATADGTLYVQNTANAGQSGQRYTIDPNTATVALIGNTGFASSCGLSGDASGNLYDGQGTQGGGFYRLDRVSGQGTLVGNPSYGQLSGFGQIYSLAFANNTMYAIGYSGPIYTVNLLDGSSTQISTYNASLIGGAWSATARLAGVPETSSLAIGLLAAGL